MDLHVVMRVTACVCSITLPTVAFAAVSTDPDNLCTASYTACHLVCVLLRTFCNEK